MANLFFIYDVLEFDERKTKTKRKDYIQKRIFNCNSPESMVSIQTINSYELAKKLIQTGQFIYLYNKKLL